MSQLIPSTVSLRIAETEQPYQAKRMIGGIGNVCSRPVLELKKRLDPRVSLVNLSELRDNPMWANLGEQN